ncbi:MAG: hypothetical protein U1F52_20895 [Burkholderiales bacterium]
MPAYGRPTQSVAVAWGIRRLAWVAAAVAGIGLPGIVRGDASRPGEVHLRSDEHWTFKLTPSYYATSHEPGAVDINLRANRGEHALWIGEYRRSGEFRQTRSGYEFTLESKVGKIVPSLMFATRGFVGGAVNAEIGRETFGMLGLGRTNARDFYNLNFDPNDAFVLGAGLRPDDHTTWSVFRVQDNRFQTGQRITHAVWRHAPAEGGHRWTVDASYKHGRPAAGADFVSGKGLSVTYDRGHAFVRAAWDEKVNYSRDDMLRLSVGVRF